MRDRRICQFRQVGLCHKGERNAPCLSFTCGFREGTERWMGTALTSNT